LVGRRFAILILIIAMVMIVQTTKAQNMEPEKGPGSYKILTGEDKPIRIPFKMHYGKPLLNLKINGEESTLMIDNGVLWDEVWLFGSSLVESLSICTWEHICKTCGRRWNDDRLFVKNYISKIQDKWCGSVESSGITFPCPGNFPFMYRL